MNKPNKRRIFITYDNHTYHKIFSFTQNKKGDIYCSWPNFKNTKWIYQLDNNGNVEFKSTNTPIDSSKLSIHNSGIVKFRNNDFLFDPLRIKGNQLVNFDEKSAGLRHLFTAITSDPKLNTDMESPYGSKDGDFTLVANNSKSFVIIFYAIPQISESLNTTIKLVFDQNHSNEELLSKIGMENFSLGFHDIAMIIYEFSPKFIKDTLIFYHDGKTIPMPFQIANYEEKKIIECEIIAQIPAFEYINNKLTISISFEGNL